MNNNETKMKTQVDKLNRDFEKKFTAQKKEFSQKLKQVASIGGGKKGKKGSPVKKSPSAAGFTEDDKAKIMNGKDVALVLITSLELKDHVDQRLEQAMEEITDRHHKEIDFLYKVNSYHSSSNPSQEVGILRCELDLINIGKRESKIRPYLEQLPQDVKGVELDLKVNNLEQALNLREDLITINKL